MIIKQPSLFVTRTPKAKAFAITNKQKIRSIRFIRKNLRC